MDRKTTIKITTYKIVKIFYDAIKKVVKIYLLKFILRKLPYYFWGNYLASGLHNEAYTYFLKLRKYYYFKKTSVHFDMKSVSGGFSYNESGGFFENFENLYDLRVAYMWGWSSFHKLNSKPVVSIICEIVASL